MRNLPIDTASFYFLLALIGILMPAFIQVYETRYLADSKPGFMFRLLKSQFVFAFLIRVQQFGYMYFVLVACQQALYSSSLTPDLMNQNKLELAISFLIISAVLIYPINISVVLLKTDPKDLQHPRLRHRFGSIYSDL
jgi:hypothetical protein